MDIIGVDLQRSDDFYEEMKSLESAPSSREQSPTPPDDSNKSSTPDSISVSSVESSTVPDSFSMNSVVGRTVHRLASDEALDVRQQRKGSTSWSYVSESSGYQFSSDLATGTTVPVSGIAFDALQQRHSTSSTNSSSTSSSESRPAVSSLYASEYLTPSINYERQTDEQLLIALIGRAFDQPNKLASLLQDRVRKINDMPVAKFMPFTVKRKVLYKGSFSVRELKEQDLICLCYNASEARILLTGPDGFYSTLLRLIERVMGSNKVGFLISNYTPPQNYSEQAADDESLISPALKSRLSHQPALVHYLEQNQVLSWTDQPSTRHADRLLQLAQLELNPQAFSCSVM